MITPVVMPQLGLEVSEGTVVEVLVSVGEAVAIDTPLVVLATDKADTEVVAPVAGVVRAIHADVGDTVNVGDALLELGESLEETESAAPALVSQGVGQAPTPSGSSDSEPANSRHMSSPPRRIRAAPVARRAAAHLGVELEKLVGSGPNGRITLKDVREAVAHREATVSQPTKEAVDHGSGDARPSRPSSATALEEPMSSLRRTIARRMTASQRDIPQFQLEREVDARHLLATTEAQRASADSGSSGPRVGINDLLIQATAETLVNNPVLLAQFVEADAGAPHLVHASEIDIGLAVATDAGLLVPILRQADQRTLRELAAERGRLVDAARAGRLDLADMTGGVMSISNLGLHGIDRFTALVNPGQSTILAVGRIVERVVPRQRGVEVIPALNLTLSCDHRVIDGAVGAKALADLAALLEGEMRWRP